MEEEEKVKIFPAFRENKEFNVKMRIQRCEGKNQMEEMRENLEI